MSWLRQVGGSLSSMTGQLSTLTKDILTEGAEESEGKGLRKVFVLTCRNNWKPEFVCYHDFIFLK